MITLDQVTLRRGARVLLDQASVALNPGEKIGLILFPAVAPPETAVKL